MEAPILFRLALTVAVLPWFVAIVMRLRGARDYVPFALAFYALCAADLASALERSLGLVSMDVVQHALYALAGILSVVGAIVVSGRRGKGRATA